MDYKIELAPLAKFELFEAIEYYQSINESLKVRIYNEFEEGLNVIQANPFLFQQVYKDKRQYILKKFPYSIFYRVVDDNIQVVSFFHQRRNPQRLERP